MSAPDCTYAIEIQDVGGTATHRILEGATAAYGLEWSPDRRNLMFYGTINGRWGFHLVSALGGTTRYLTSAAAMFWAGGDSLLIAPQVGADSVFYARVTSLGGVVADSIRVAGPGQALAGLSVMPSGRWIVGLVVQEGRGLWQVFDRSGKVADQVSQLLHLSRDESPTTPSGSPARGPASSRSCGWGSIPRTGRLATRQDTLLSGTSTTSALPPTAATLVIDDGTSDDQVLGPRFRRRDGKPVSRRSEPPPRLHPGGSRALA